MLSWYVSLTTIEGFDANGNLFLHVDFFYVWVVAILPKKSDRIIWLQIMVIISRLFEIDCRCLKIQFYFIFIYYTYKVDFFGHCHCKRCYFLLLLLLLCASFICMITWFSRSSSALSVPLPLQYSFQWFSRTQYVIIYYRLPKKLDGNMCIFMAEELRPAITFLLLLLLVQFSFYFFKNAEDEVEDSSEIEMSIVNKSTPFIHKIRFFSFFLLFILIRTTIRYAIRAHMHTHVCLCLGFLYVRFAIPVYRIRLFHFFYLAVCVWLEGTVHCYLHLNNVTSKK